MGIVGKRGFSLIEVLTVIGIIALLTAILFPVFSRAREQARQTTCMSNMHDLYVGISLYRQDYEAYPPIMFGVPENADGSPWQVGSGNPVPATQIQRGYLYPAYVKSAEKFHCPNNPIADQTAVVNGSFPLNAGYSGLATYGTHGIPFGDPTAPVPYYAYDSYDISASLNNTAAYEVVYSRDWTNAEGRGIDPQQDNPNQLKYPNPPPDQTVLTWCNWHVRSGSDRCPLMLLSGTARKAFWKDVQAKSWNLMGP